MVKPILDIDDLMSGLFLRRRIFHSEADFQHALAWHIHETRPDCDIRLEFNPLSTAEKKIALDIWVQFPEAAIAIELKYCTRLLEQEWLGEHFALRNQSAQDTRRYDFLRDIQRVEQTSATRDRAVHGFAIMLTNDPSYWTPQTKVDAVDAAFRIHDGRLVSSDELRWGERASAGTKKNREEPIRLAGSYGLRWRDYSAFGDQSGERFRYLAVAVPPVEE